MHATHPPCTSSPVDLWEGRGRDGASPRLTSYKHIHTHTHTHTQAGLFRPCACPMMHCHRHCLARWQLQNAGRRCGWGCAAGRCPGTTDEPAAEAAQGGGGPLKLKRRGGPRQLGRRCDQRRYRTGKRRWVR